MKLIYETNVLKLKIFDDNYFGTITDVNGDVYKAYEIHFHTPGKYKII